MYYRHTPDRANAARLYLIDIISWGTRLLRCHLGQSAAKAYTWKPPALSSWVPVVVVLARDSHCVTAEYKYMQWAALSPRVASRQGSPFITLQYIIHLLFSGAFSWLCAKRPVLTAKIAVVGENPRLHRMHVNPPARDTSSVYLTTACSGSLRCCCCFSVASLWMTGGLYRCHLCLYVTES